MILVLDTLAGALLAIAGLLAWRRSRISALFLLGAAAAWFAASAVPGVALVHRPLLLHAILAFPRGGTHGVPPRLLLVVAWAGTLFPPDLQPWVSLATAVLCLTAAANLSTRSGRDLRPGEVVARQALLLMSAGLALPVLQRLVWPVYAQSGVPLATYLCAVSLCAGVLIWRLVFPVRQEDEVIELSDSTPADALAELRRLSELEQDLERVRAMESAMAMLEDNTRLQQDLAERIEEVRASRSRLVGAAVGERQRLEQVLEDGALRYLDELEACLRSTAGHEQGATTVATCLTEVRNTRNDVRLLARGLHPRVLTDQGLAAALEDLASRSAVPTEVSAPAGRFPEPVETTVWYACAEALANVSKHAQATRASVHVTTSQGVMRATVGDDGVGGAALASGGGLDGLVDRLSVVGGRLALASSSAGTEVTVEVPL